MTRSSARVNSKIESMDLSIIIVNWNTKELTEQCLRSVFENLSHVKMSFEVIVVDNASSDGSAEMVKDGFASVRLICNQSNAGYVKANNQAAAIAKGRYLLLLNSDTKVLDNTMPTIIDYLDSQPEVGIATAKVLNSDKTFQSPYRRFPGIFDAILNHTLNKIISINSPFQKRHKYENLDSDKIHSVDSVTGAYLFIRKSLVREGKVFDEEIFMYYEDTLLCKNIRNQGFQIVYLPYAPIVHHHGASARKVRPDAIYNSFLGSVVYIKKVYGENSAKQYAKIVRLVWRLLVFGFGILRIIPISKFREKDLLFRELLAKST